MSKQQEINTRDCYTTYHKMNKYNPQIHHRRSIRLKGYDYSQAGLYFVTICVQKRKCLFGKIVGTDLRVCPEMILNDAGKMVEKWYYVLEQKFPDIKCHQMMIMPNHFHCIIENVGAIGADLRVRPITNDSDKHINNHPDKHINNDSDKTEGEHIGSPLYRVVQWFKTMTTNEYIRGVKNLGWQPFDGKLWQRNYYEHIIRNEKSYHNITNYIINNPANWTEDTFYG
ncbi:MAG: transposase [Candidatus Kapaibacterium sp.]